MVRDSASLELSQQETTQIKEIFDLFDTNGGGSIDQQELDAAMFALGFNQNCQSTDNVKPEIPNKSVTLEDFILIMKGEKSGSCQNEDVWLSFSVLSQSGRSRDLTASTSSEKKAAIDLDTLKHACQRFEVRLKEDELEYMMNEADYDKSGSVDILKFMLIMQRTPWF